MICCDKCQDKQKATHMIGWNLTKIQGGEVMKSPELIFCECCGERKPWSTLYHGLQSRGRLMAVCPARKEYLERKDKEANNG